MVSAEAAKQAVAGCALRLMFEDEARLGRISDPRRAWAPPGVLDSLVLPEVNAETMSLFLAEVARRHPSEFILIVLEGAGWHRAGDVESDRAYMGRVAGEVAGRPHV